MRLQAAGCPHTWTPTLLMPLTLLLLACGGDEAPTEPEPSPPEAEEAARAQAQALFTSLEPVVARALELMLTGGGTMEGEQGTLTVAGSTMTLESFSADGQLVLDGELVLDLLAQPLTLRGDLQASGLESREGPVPVKVDVTIDISTDPRTYGGTVTVGEYVHDLDELFAEE